MRLTELPAGTPVAVVVRQLTEHVQGDVSLISRLKDAGVVPNARVQVESNPTAGSPSSTPATRTSICPTRWRAVKVEKV